MLAVFRSVALLLKDDHRADENEIPEEVNLRPSARGRHRPASELLDQTKRWHRRRAMPFDFGLRTGVSPLNDLVPPLNKCSRAHQLPLEGMGRASHLLRDIDSVRPGFVCGWQNEPGATWGLTQRSNIGTVPPWMHHGPETA